MHVRTESEDMISMKEAQFKFPHKIPLSIEQYHIRCGVGPNLRREPSSELQHNHLSSQSPIRDGLDPSHLHKMTDESLTAS